MVKRRLLSQVIFTIIVIISLFSLSLPFCASVSADTSGGMSVDYFKADVKKVFTDEGLFKGVGNDSDAGLEGKTDLKLIGKNKTDGQGILTEIMKQLTNYWKQMLGFVAVMMIVIAGFRVVTSSEEETINTNKTIILWVFIGLIFILASEQLVTQVLYGGATGEIGEFKDGGSAIFDTEIAAATAAAFGSQLVADIISWARMIVGAIAIVMIVLSGIRMILAFGSEELVKQEQMVFYWVGFGLIMLALNQVLVKMVFEVTVVDPKTGTKVATDPLLYAKPGDVEYGIQQIAGVIQWMLGFLAVIAFCVIVYGGYLLVVNWGYEEGTEQAKKMITSAIIGMVIIFSSYAIIATMIGATTVGSGSV